MIIATSESEEESSEEKPIQTLDNFTTEVDEKQEHFEDKQSKGQRDNVSTKTETIDEIQKQIGNDALNEKKIKSQGCFFFCFHRSPQGAPVPVLSFPFAA